MKATFKRFGIYAALFELAFFAISWTLVKITNADFDTQELIGYAGILLCLSFVYFGIRHYRDNVNGGIITFTEGLKLGLLIVLVPAVCFALTDTLEIILLDPHFYEKYATHMIDELRKSTPAAQLPAKLKEMKAQMDFYSKPYINFIIMFLTVAAVGILVTLVSAFILKRKRVHSIAQ